jgi:hypothetical protein
MAETKPPAPTASFKDLLADIAAREPRPQINVALANGNRVSLTNWYLATDCVIECWPNGRPRYLVPYAQIVLIEVPKED